MFDSLDREVVLIARFVCAIVAFFIDADDVVHAGTMARNRDHAGEGRLFPVRSEKVTNNRYIQAAIEDESLPTVIRIFTRFEGLGAQRRAFRETAEQLEKFSSELLLPEFSVGPIGGAESETQRGRSIAVLGPLHGIEMTGFGGVESGVWHAVRRMGIRTSEHACSRGGKRELPSGGAVAH